MSSELKPVENLNETEAAEELSLSRLRSLPATTSSITATTRRRFRTRTMMR